MRAIEKGRYLARAANTGSADSSIRTDGSCPIGSLRGTRRSSDEVRLLDDVTIYARIGDLVAYLSLVVTIAALGAAAGRTPARERTIPWLSSSMISSTRYRI